MTRSRIHIWLFIAPILVLQGSGCRLAGRSSLDAIPARHLPASLAPIPRDALVPIDFGLLRTPPPEQHLVGAGDVLGIQIQDVLDDSGQPPEVHYALSEQGTNVETPAVGIPVRVQPDGTISLPQIEPIRVDGLTLSQVVEAIRKPYLEQAILKQGQDRIEVNLIKPRTFHVIVIREDINSPITLNRNDSHVLTRHGQGQVLELPVYENDLLNAITLTGGLPGTDAENEISILHSDGSSMLLERMDSGYTAEECLQFENQISRITRVPLRVLPGEPLPFTTEDIILADGDIVFVDSRKKDYFFVGGLLKGGKIPLPRDEDVDILEAVAIANGRVNGPASTTDTTINSRGPGAIVPPTRVVIVRKLADGSQIKIDVDLKVALNNPRERVLVQSGDFVMLKYKAHEIMANVALNLVNFAYVIPN